MVNCTVAGVISAGKEPIMKGCDVSSKIIHLNKLSILLRGDSGKQAHLYSCLLPYQLVITHLAGSFLSRLSPFQFSLLLLGRYIINPGWSGDGAGAQRSGEEGRAL